MGFTLTDPKEIQLMLKGHIEFGNISMVWDLTDYLLKKEPNQMLVTKNGRIIMPSLGII